MALSVGSMAPDFTLKTRKGTEMLDVTLSKARGKPVLLLFFPLAFTAT
jgi:peroxiredoxin